MGLSARKYFQNIQHIPLNKKVNPGEYGLHRKTQMKPVKPILSQQQRLIL